MSEQAAPAEGGTPPAVAGPEGTPGAAEQQTTQQEIDWQDRYQHLQPEYTRATQQNRLYEQMLTAEDPDTRREAAAQLGYEFADEEEPVPDADEDPIAAYGERLGRLEQSLAEQDQEREDDAYAAQVRAVVDERLDGLGIPKDDQDWVLAYAINALPATEEGLPDLRQAYEVFQARELERQKAWARTKQAPRISPDGQPATEAPNLDNRQERQDFIMRRMMDNDAGY
jgi:hypothetical protein